jgi:hypothetical protein
MLYRFYKTWLILYFVVRTLKKVCKMSKELAQANLLGAYALGLSQNSKIYSTLVDNGNWHEGNLILHEGHLDG